MGWGSVARRWVGFSSVVGGSGSVARQVGTVREMRTVESSRSCSAEAGQQGAPYGGFHNDMAFGGHHDDMPR